MGKESNAAVKNFVKGWRAKVGNWTNMGVVYVAGLGHVDLISEAWEQWIYEHLTMVVVSIASELFGVMKAEVFGHAMDSRVEGILNINETRVFVTNGTQSIYRGGAAIMDWVDGLMDDNDEEWFENTTVTASNKPGWSANIFPVATLKGMMRQSLGMGVGFLEASMQTAETRVFGQWMKNILNVTQASRRLAAAHVNTT